ncbi:MAG: PEP-CTERM sorting domain-containing protein [Opitutaceae bacterium]|jgi:hypothetical protein
MKTLYPYRSLILASGLLALSSVGCGAATLVADFTDGTSTTAADGYTGAAGNGWVAGWVVTPGNAASSTFALSSASPLATGGGNYLTASITSAGSGTAASTGRRYAASGGASISTSDSVSYTFNFRADSITGGSSYRFADMDNAYAAGSGPAQTWAFSIDNGGLNLANGDGAGNKTTVGAGALIVANTTYTFNITANTAAKTWSLQLLSASGSVLYTSGTLGFRASYSGLGGVFVYATADNDSTPSDFSSSIDSLNITSISSIPEPSTASILIGGAVLGCAVFRRRR